MAHRKSELVTTLEMRTAAQRIAVLFAILENAILEFNELYEPRRGERALRFLEASHEQCADCYASLGGDPGALTEDGQNKDPD